jgi:hypothetical protein
MLIVAPRRSSPRLSASSHDHSPSPTISLLPGEPFCLFIPRTIRTRGVAMPGYILTGAPGAGKTAVLRLLEINGHLVVEEAATDAIALDNALGREEPWHDHAFIDKIVTLQRQRQHSV